MQKIKRNYLNILKIELEDLHQDIESLIEECKKERERGHLSKYVCLENLAMFKRELLSMDNFFKVLNEINPDDFETLDEMIVYLKNCFISKVNEHGFAEAIGFYVERKLEKVAKYIIS